MKYVSFSFIMLFLALWVTAKADISQIVNQCIPKLTYFDKTVYNASNQTWAIAQNEKGYLYFANSGGLLEYDGSEWTLYQIPHNSSAVRSVLITNDQRIYVGMQNEFGFWERDPYTRKLLYTSISTEHNIRFTDENDFWKIIPFQGDIYFNCFQNIYKYSPTTNQVTIIKAPTRFQFAFAVNNRFFAQDKTLGLMELKDGILTPVAGGAVLKGDCVYGMAPLNDNDILIATIDKGLYQLVNGKVTKNNWACNDFLIRNQIFSMTMLPDGRYAFGTILNGLLITDHTGNILSNINKLKGLPNNTVLSIFLDHSNNIWLGLDRGIDHIQLNSRIRTFPDPKGELGSVYQVEQYNGNLFFATNQGLVYCSLKDFNYPDREVEFHIMPNTQGQVWSLLKINNQLLCAHNQGLYVVSGNTGRFVYTGSGISNMLEMNSHVVMLLSYDGLCMLKMNGTQFNVQPEAVYPYNAAYAAKDRKNDLFIGNYASGVYRIQFDSTFNHVIYASNHLESLGIHNSTVQRMYSYDNNLYLLDTMGIMQFDYAQNHFEPMQAVNRLLPTHNSLYRLQFSGNDLWCFGSKQFYCIRNYNTSRPYLISKNLETLYPEVISNYEAIKKLDADNYLICTSNSFSVVNINYAISNMKENQVYIRDIGEFSNKMVSKSLPHPIAYYASHFIEFPHSANTIYIRFTLPDYENTGEIEYSYRLSGKGSNNNFSIPSQNNIATLSNLPSGDYVFQVKATVKGTNQVFYSQLLKITILPPWYFSWIGFIILLILLALLAYGLYSYIQWKLMKQHQRISEQHEKEIAIVETKLLQEKVEKQNEELSRITKHMLQKSRLINKVDAEIEKLAADQAVPTTHLRGLKMIVEKNRNPEKEWEMFEMSFNKTYDNYLVKLSNRFPGLTTGDLKLAAYIRMNISTKEIAGLLNVSGKSVEMGRYRLRRKLNLPHDQNLTEFLMSL
ncbi:triple tyrosine motif-containing protein [Microbacter margulisiae]|uniref:Ligand-binding sensor domain-containing protein/DNA-binding CsgD family transcriptional regulator n=1 Tax=Microbacter margulisiae TaxID=1350067 RepID=A0A7W5H2F2_9PORP|nr:triple tyrosine motif-containing protein [Microbacter margulisiae]MBB3187564.1 ligand-binding sensor domain-containing protein/DNA-binding CsgD family transcriptional regulator [Microbacter margulisiae]